MAVGRHHLERAVLELEQRAVELEARLLGRDGEEDLGDHAPEVGEGNLDLRAVLDRRAGSGSRPGARPWILKRDVPARMVRTRGSSWTRWTSSPVSERMISMSFLAWTAMPPSSLDVGLAPRGQRDVEVGGGEVEPVLAGGEQQVGEHRDGRLALDDALHRDQLAQKLAAVEADFHSLFSV